MYVKQQPCANTIKTITDVKSCSSRASPFFMDPASDFATSNPIIAPHRTTLGRTWLAEPTKPDRVAQPASVKVLLTPLRITNADEDGEVTLPRRNQTFALRAKGS